MIFFFFVHSVSDFLMGEQDMVLSDSAMSKQHSRVRLLFLDSTFILIVLESVSPLLSSPF